MKKTLLTTFAALLVATTAIAQKSIFDKDERVYYGVRLGLGLSHLQSDIASLDGNKTSAGLNFGFAAGINLSQEYPVILESGLYYVERGGEGRYDNHKITYDINYLSVPIVAKYRVHATDEISVLPFLGGYFALGISGKTKDHDTRQSRSSFGGDRFQRFDGGLKFGCGIEYQMLYLELAYDLGLSNISHDDFDDCHNRCFLINAGVNF